MRDYAVAFLSQAGYFAAVLFLPVYAEGPAVHATEGQIGLIVAGGNLAGFLSSFAFGRLADVRGRRAILLAGVAASGAAVLLPLLAADPLSLGVFWFAFGFAGGMFPGSLLAHAYEAGRPLGRFSAVGSLGWGLGTFLAGIVAMREQRNNRRAQFEQGLDTHVSQVVVAEDDAARAADGGLRRFRQIRRPKVQGVERPSCTALTR